MKPIPDRIFWTPVNWYFDAATVWYLNYACIEKMGDLMGVGEENLHIALKDQVWGIGPKRAAAIIAKVRELRAEIEGGA